MKRAVVEVDLARLLGIVRRATESAISAEEAAELEQGLRTMADALKPKRTSEKTKNVLGEKPGQQDQTKVRGKRKGHGRTAAADYTGAEKVTVPHQQHKHGDPCPDCGQGKLYVQSSPKTVVRIVGQAPLAATVYEMERLRCNACGQVLTARTPEQAAGGKFDETATAMIALLKYGSGMPWTRLSGLEKALGIPLAEATQWEEVEKAAELIQPAHEALIQAAADGGVIHHDDTGMRVLNMVRPEGDKRTGVFTSGLVSVGQWKAALYFTGREHAGENLAQVLKRRKQGLPPPIRMADASSSNKPKGAAVEPLEGNCLAHGRRYFVDCAESFPEQCGYVLDLLGKVWVHDEQARKLELSPAQRLDWHKQHSGPVMDELKGWFGRQMEEHLVEPNSRLGKAIQYMRNHWEGLTLFLREPGAPIDNNLCERALKKPVLHRKNSLFYRTLHGAEVGDLFMSLIQTCALNEVNSLDYLTELLRNPGEVAMNPAAWLPWNYPAKANPAG